MLIIDEANELRTLLNQPDGQDALHNLFKCMVMNTKEKRKFHMLLGSSEFFPFMGLSICRTISIRDIRDWRPVRK